jgi:hypothetical protein
MKIRIDDIIKDKENTLDVVLSAMSFHNYNNYLEFKKGLLEIRNNKTSINKIDITNYNKIKKD